MSTPVQRALYGKLAGDTTLNALLATPNIAGFPKSIYYEEAPAGAAYPYIIFNQQSGVPTEAFTDPSALETDVWLVKAVDRNTTADVAESIRARCVVLLNDTTLSISGASLLYLRRRSDVRYPENTDGIQYRHAGSLFRLITTD